MLRLDVDGADPYAIPPTNPFADGVSGRKEVYAYGLRNPYRWRFARPTGALAELRGAASWLPRSYTYPGRPISAWLRPLLPLRLLPWLEAVGASAATLKTTVITRPVVAACHGAGVAVHAWTVNDPRTAKILVERGVDAIITDDPRSVPGGMTDT